MSVSVDAVTQGSLANHTEEKAEEKMDMNTLFVIVLVLLLLGGGGFFYARRA